MISNTRLKEIATVLRDYGNLDYDSKNSTYAKEKFIAECREILPDLLYTLKYVQDEHIVMHDTLKEISKGTFSNPEKAASDVLKRLNLL